jgi:hypothetical protein
MACGKFALKVCYGVIALGIVLGFLSAIATGAESVSLHVLTFALVAALIANFLSILWIIAAREPKPEAVPPATILERKPPVPPPDFTSACLPRSLRPPRSSV